MSGLGQYSNQGGDASRGSYRTSEDTAHHTLETESRTIEIQAWSNSLSVPVCQALSSCSIIGIVEPPAAFSMIMYSAPTGFRLSEFHESTRGTATLVCCRTIRMPREFDESPTNRSIPYSRIATSDSVVKTGSPALRQGILAIISFLFAFFIRKALLNPPSILSTAVIGDDSPPPLLRRLQPRTRHPDRVSHSVAPTGVSNQ